MNVLSIVWDTGTDIGCDSRPPGWVLEPLAFRRPGTRVYRPIRCNGIGVPGWPNRNAPAIRNAIHDSFWGKSSPADGGPRRKDSVDGPPSGPFRKNIVHESKIRTQGVRS